MNFARIIAVFLFSIQLTTCSHSTRLGSHTSNQHAPVLSDSALRKKLEEAYTSKNDSTWDALFKEWNNVSQSTDENEINRNDTIRSVYDVYKQFYQPHSLLKLGNWEWGNRLNEDSKYVVVRSDIQYMVMNVDTIPELSYFFDKEKIDPKVINDFNPPLNLNKDKILYLLPGYEQAINSFLGTDMTKMGEGNIMNPAFPKGETEARYEKLRKYIPALAGHWSGYWHIATHPEVYIIMFNKTLDKAQVQFQVGYQGGETNLQRTASGWKITSSKETWIE